MGRFADLANEINDGIETLKRELIDVVNEEMDVADANTYKEYGAIEKKKIEEIFKSAVDAFYAGYGPKDMPYERNYSLYNVLDFEGQIDEDGMVITKIAGYTNLFNPDAATALERAKGTVFDLAFMKGYHGGATGEDHNGVVRSVPSYRTPYPKDDDPDNPRGYRWWGKTAAKEGESPHKVFKMELKAAEDGELEAEFNRIYNEQEALAHDRITERQVEIERRIFG